MPVEIKELIIRATVLQETEDAGSAEDETADNDNQAIIQACVRQVLRILKRSKER